MRRVLLLLLLPLLWLLPTGLRAQRPARLPAGLLNPDSQRVWRLRPPSADTGRINAPLDQTQHHLNTNLDSAQQLAEATVALAWRRGQGKGLVYGINYAATVYGYASDYPAAQRGFALLLWAARRAGRPEMVAAAYLGQGNVARNLNNYVGAEGYYRQAQAAYAAQRPPSRQGELAALGNRAYNALDRDSLAQARRLVRQALALLRQVPEARHPASFLVQLGLVQQKSQQYDSAALAFEQAVRVARVTHDLNPEAEALQALAELALRYARQAAARFGARHDPQQEADALKQQAAALAGLRRPEEAYATLRRYLTLYDSALVRQRAEDVVVAQARFDRAGQETRIAGLEKDRRIQVLETAHRTTRTRLLATLGTGAALLLLAGVVLGYRRRQRRREAALRQRLAADLHDDVGNLLTQISLQSNLLRENPNTPEQLLLRLDRLASTAHQTARQMNDVIWSLGDESQTLPQLIARMRDHAHEMLAPTAIELDFQVDDGLTGTELPPEVRQNLYLIFKESLHNVVKHAHGATLVQVRLDRAAGQVLLRVQDNGRAPAGSPSRLGGNGLRNMHTRAEALGGTLVARPTGGGFEVQAALPG